MRAVLRRVELGAVLAAILLALWSFWYEPSQLLVRDHAVPIAGAADAGLAGLKIAVITDLHAGAPFVDSQKISAVVALTNASRPDLVLLLGDYVSHVVGGTGIPFKEVARILQGLHAPLGVYAVLGEQDWREDYDGIAHALGGAGIIVLEDRGVEIRRENSSFYLSGISDFDVGAHDVDRALDNLPRGGKALCITHTPDIFPNLPDGCLLTLAGHTHGGQVDLPFLGRLIVPSRYGQRYAAGLVKEKDHYLFTATGIGTSNIPIRFGVPPEISILKILDAR